MRWAMISKLGLLLALPSVAGCSFVFVDAPPSRPQTAHSRSEVECTTSKAAPVVDTIITGFQMVRTGVAVSADDEDYRGAAISRDADLGFGLGLTALFGASAIYGYVVTGQCKDAKASEGPVQPPQYQQEVWAPPPTASAPLVTPPPPLALAPAPARACTPGSTQACVGAGACSGGQSCAADGTAWNPCQCEPEPEDAEAGVGAPSE